MLIGLNRFIKDFLNSSQPGSGSLFTHLVLAIEGFFQVYMVKYDNLQYTDSFGKPNNAPKTKSSGDVVELGAKHPAIVNAEAWLKVNMTGPALASQ